MDTDPFQGTNRAGPQPAWLAAPSAGAVTGGKQPQKCPLFAARSPDDSADFAAPAAFGGDGGSCDGARRRFRGAQKLLSLGPSEDPRCPETFVTGSVGGSAVPGNFCPWARRRPRRHGGSCDGARRRFRATRKLLSPGPPEVPPARWQARRARRRFRGVRKLLSLGPSEAPRSRVRRSLGGGEVRGGRRLLSLTSSEGPRYGVPAVSGRWGSPRWAETFVPGLVGGRRRGVYRW